MLYPNRLQVALLFDRPMRELDAIMRDFMRIEGMRTGTQFNLAGAIEGRFCRLFGGAEELRVTFEYFDVPAAAQLFKGALASPCTGIATPDIRERLGRTHSHMLVEVSHGVMAGVDEDQQFAAILEASGHPKAGATQAQFERRLGILALIARIATDHAMPLAVHWTQSDQLLSGDLFDRLAAAENMPGPLHIHPFLFGPRPDPGTAPLVGIRTFGARHWLGREIIVKPNPLPWATNFDTILAFLKVATMTDGYVIPDGDTFGPEDRSLSYRVLHHDAGTDTGSTDIPLYELVPLEHAAHGFVAPDHVPAAANPGEQSGETAAADPAPQGSAAGEPHVAPAAVPAIAPTPSRPGLPSPSGRGLRSRVFGRKGQ